MPKRYTQTRGQLHDAQRKVAFGLDRKAKWPDAGMPPREINGITHFVLPKVVVYNGLNRRCLAVCPDCGRFTCAGHLEQHRQGHHG